MNRFRAIVLAVALGLATAGCSGEITFKSDNIVPGNEVETRAIERHRAANDARNAMVLLLVVAVGPLTIATVTILALRSDRRAGAT